MTDFPTADGHDASCADYGVSRRNLLKSAGLIGMAGVATSMFGDVLTSTAFGADGGGNVLVVLSLRGGADGMSMVVPHAEANFYQSRPNIAQDLKKANLLGADDTFGLHPAFSPLLPWWNKPTHAMAAIHATGMVTPNRSHFEAMELIEDADAGSSERVGWLNRMIGCFTQPDIFDGVQVGGGTMPTSLIGPAPSLATSDFGSLSVPWGGSKDMGPRSRAALRSLYEKAGSVIGAAGLQALALDQTAGVVAKQKEADDKTTRNGAVYPGGDLSAALKNSAALIRSGVGVRAVAVDYGGWDHHVDITWKMRDQISVLSRNIAAFMTDLGAAASRVTIVTISEFGRRLGQNGAAGLDHGHGNVMLAVGAGVKPGYFSRWPTLNERDLSDGDLKVTIDYRCVLAEILETRFKDEVGVGTVFPGLGPDRLGFMSPY